MKHTPGPWRVEGNEVWSSSPELSATVTTIAARPGSPTAKADARLIAAAPELFEALREVLAAGDACTYAGPDADDVSAMLRFGKATDAAMALVARLEKDR